MEPSSKTGALIGSRPLSWRGFRGRVKDGVDPAAALALLGEPEEDWAATGRAEFVKDKLDKGSRVYRAFLDLGSGPEEVFIKTVDGSLTFAVMRERMAVGADRWWHYPVKMVKLLWGGSVARRCWKAEAACARAGVPAAEHIFYLSRRQGLFRREAIVSRGVVPRPGPNAREYFGRLAERPAGRERRAHKRELFEQLGTLLRRVRESGITFPDFKLHNLVMRERPGGGFEFVVVDLAEASRKWPADPEGVFLRRFAMRLPGFSIPDRVRLARAYLAAGRDQRSWRDLCALITPRV